MVMVAILGILCLVLIYVAVFFDPYPYNSTRYFVATPEITNRTIDDEVRWDATVEITNVLPPDEYHHWSRIHLQVTNRDGIVLNMRLDLNEYDESKLDDNEDGTIMVQAWYIDKSYPPKGVSRNDKIVITGMSRAYERAYVRIVIEDNHGGSDFMLPDEFV